MKKYVYTFGAGQAEGRADMKNLLGGKGANLAEMSNLGISVPAGFTISTEVCTAFYENDRQFPEGLDTQVQAALANVEGLMECEFDDSTNPLLLSVRSGARVSMPGMMDTVLNLGLNDTTVQGLIAQSGDERFAYDCYRRFVQMYGDVVLGLKPVDKYELDPFEVIIDRKKAARGIELDTDLDADGLKALVKEFKAEIKQKLGMDFPEDPMEQLWGAIGAVFGSWNTDRAIAYRQMNNFPEHWGTAVNVQAMVFGNMGEGCGTGVAFTRDPATGENVFYGEYLMNAQGEDVVAGTRTPQPVNLAQKRKTASELMSLEEEMPEIYAELEQTAKRLDTHYRDMNDLEFTIQKGKLWMLQTRIGKRTGFAAFKMAVDMVREDLITKEEALLRVDPEQLNQLLRPVFDPQEKAKATSQGKVLAKGLNAGPGAAAGRAVFNAEDAEEWAGRGEAVILVRIETSPEDIRGMNAAKGILTARGGMTSHAALVARQMGKVCVAGCGALVIDYGKHQMVVGDQTIKEGDYISIDGTTGEVMAGQMKTMPSEVLQVIEGQRKAEDSQVYQDYSDLLSWADDVRKLGIRANADQPDQARTAVAFGAEGIGLCRTEHMFFEEDRIDSVREMILSDDLSDRKKALAKLLPMQREDFAGLFRAMDGFPVIIRTLDPPLHEFLPHGAEGIAELARNIGASAEKLQAKADSLHETNPMLGHRGCRLGIVYPEITEMQARAIFEAACEVAKEGITVIPEVMIPLVGHVNELRSQKTLVDRVAKEVIASYGVELKYLIGTMIELPRAALTADKIAEEAEFFSYGTNDLTQTTFGLSRDDAKFLPDYLAKDIWEKDPFQTIDQEGVGALIQIGVEKGRSTRPDLEIGICGEHGGDPASVEFCHRIGMNYVSCSPYRVPIARLAAAQAVLKEK
ncbi:MAG: pyruvate, phosphate dikinase [Candidatus Latescibacterota bacterium]